MRIRIVPGVLLALFCTACGSAGQPNAAPSSAAQPTSTVAASAAPSLAGPTPSPSGGDRVEVVGRTSDPRFAATEVGLDPAGAVADLSFRDVNGYNTVVLRQFEQRSEGSVLADHIVEYPMLDERRVLREVRDGVSDCEFDVTSSFIPGSLEVRDFDEDLVGEVVFAYRLACRSDVSSADQKLLLLEDGKKYILRGRTNLESFDSSLAFEDPVPEPAAADWPRGSFTWALARYRELAPEFVEREPS